jgi:hypothetical protein
LLSSNVGTEGFEPDAATADSDITLRQVTVTGAAQSGAAPANSPSSDPDLARVIETWQTLPEPIRKAILALIQSGRVERPQN